MPLHATPCYGSLFVRLLVLVTTPYASPPHAFPGHLGMDVCPRHVQLTSPRVSTENPWIFSALAAAKLER